MPLLTILLKCFRCCGSATGFQPTYYVINCYLFQNPLDGRIDLEHYRGRSCYAFAVQAAERAVRVATERTGVRDLRLVSAERHEARRWRVAFAVDDDVIDVDVAAERGELTYLTCNAEAAKHPWRFTATLEVPAR